MRQPVRARVRLRFRENLSNCIVVLYHFRYNGFRPIGVYPDAGPRLNTHLRIDLNYFITIFQKSPNVAVRLKSVVTNVEITPSCHKLEKGVFQSHILKGPAEVEFSEVPRSHIQRALHMSNSSVIIHCYINQEALSPVL